MTDKSGAATPFAWPLWLALLAAIVLAAIIGHALIRIPVSYNDNFSEIVAVYRTPIGEILTDEFREPHIYFRPFEMVWRYVIAYGLGEGIFGYNIFLVACLALMTVAFALVCHPRNMRDLTAFLVALAVLVGHHAMQASWEYNIIISNGVVVLAGIVSIPIIRGSGALWTQICAVLLAAICLLTKEVGLVVAGVFVLAHLLQMPGVRRGTAIIIAFITLAYLVFHFATLPDLSYSEKHHATTFGEFSSNFLATIVMFWLGLPTDGVWTNVRLFLTEPWQWIQIGAGAATLVLLICGWRLAPTPIEREAFDALEFERRWFLLFGTALLGCAALGFYYTRHRHGAPAVPLLAYCTYLSMQVLLWRLDEAGASGGSSLFWRRSSPLLVLMTVAGLACAVLWPLRLVNGFEYARDMGGQIRSKWHNAMVERWYKSDAREKPYLVPFAESVDSTPWPRRFVPVLRSLGRKASNSVNH